MRLSSLEFDAQLLYIAKECPHLRIWRLEQRASSKGGVGVGQAIPLGLPAFRNQETLTSVE